MSVTKLLFSICIFTFPIFIYSQQPKLVLPIGHNAEIFNAFFSNDDSKVVTASFDGTAKIWDATNGRLISDLRSHKSRVEFAVFNPTGDKILTTSSDSTAKIWDVNSGSLLHNLKGHTASVIKGSFSHDGNKIVTVSVDNTAKVWGTENGHLIYDLKDHKSIVFDAFFSPDGFKIFSASYDNTIKIWNSETGRLIGELQNTSKLLNSIDISDDGNQIVASSWENDISIWDAKRFQLIKKITGHKNLISSAQFSPNGQKVATSSWDSTAKIWDASTGKLVFNLIGHSSIVSSVAFNKDGTKLITSSHDNTAIIWDVKTGELLLKLVGHNRYITSATFSNDGRKIITASGDETAKIWDAITGRLVVELIGHTYWINSISFSKKGDRLVSTSWDNTAKLWDSKTSKLLHVYEGHNSWVYSASISPDGDRIVTSSSDKTCKIWDIDNEKILFELKGHNGTVYSANYSPDGKAIVTACDDRTINIWNAYSGELISKIDGHNSAVNYANFSPDGKTIISASNDATVKLWDAYSGKLLFNLKNHSSGVFYASFSPDGKKIVSCSYDSTINIYDSKNGHLLSKLIGHKGVVFSATFSPDGNKLISASIDHLIKIWDVNTGLLISEIEGTTGCFSAMFSPSGNEILGLMFNNTFQMWNSTTGELIYTFFSIDKKDYLISDKYGRYDGTEKAREFLYFICNSEIIDLKQLKDQLWVPNLAERINSGESIDSKTLDDLDICGIIPIVKRLNDSLINYRFLITPQRGGLGKTVLFVNDFPIKTYRPDNLLKTTTGYELRIAQSELLPNFLAGQTNQVSVRSFIANDSIGSRGGRVIVSDREKEKPPPPNLYAVMIGVSDYKGDELDLKYAAKDAKDLSAALAVSARKLLNFDGQEHVFVYDLTTTEGKYRLPEKEAIRKLLQEIGTKTKPNDMLLLFFAGHGVMAGEANKQFYFLTADASPSTATENPSAVGISMMELMEWVKLQNVNAQKRILILDACNSGQAIKDFVKLGGNDQGYMAARSDERGQQIKAIDKLNEQTGFSILSASASSQSAYEMGRYSQGLLTYSLLRAIKLQPDILEQGKYLDVSRWFGAAEKTVSEISKSIGERQDPQRVASNNFNLGVVDEEVLRKIILPQEKPLFGPVNLQNADEAISSDDLELGKLLHNVMTDISARGEDGAILFDKKYESEEVWTVGGRYEIQNSIIKVRINIKQGKQTPKHRFELTGSIDKLKELAEEIVRKAIVTVRTN
jgi:WD40 repeat protein/uncharacterized caspase-like protein